MPPQLNTTSSPAKLRRNASISVARPPQVQTARRQLLDDPLQVTVGALARQDFVTDHEQPETQRHRPPRTPGVGLCT
jgi:hypothetical protein